MCRGHSTRTFLKQTQEYSPRSKNSWIQKENAKEYSIARVYFLVLKGGEVAKIKTENPLNMYIPKNFGRIFKKDNDKALFDILVKVSHTYIRVDIYEGKKRNVVRYDLKSFHTEYDYLDNEY